MTVVPLFKSYFKLAIRHSWRNKWAVLINVVGLGMALSMCIFLYMIYAFNIEFDTAYEGTEDVYRLHSFTMENGVERRNEMSPMALDNALRNNVGGINELATYYAVRTSIKTDDDYFAERVAFVSTEFLDMFETPLWYGSFAPFGEQPVAYLSRDLAKKYFGDEIALDRTLSIYLGGSNKREVVVAGVFERLPPNRSFDTEIVVHYSEYSEAYNIDANDWKNHRYLAHYMRTSPEQLADIETQINRYIPQQNEGHEERKITRFELVPFLSPTVANHTLWRSYVTSRLRPEVYFIFSTLIGMVFLIACFNLANTSMAMTSNRLKEIGIRKTLGSRSKQILVQFLFEMGVICSLAFVLAIALANTTSQAILGLFGATFVLQDIDLTGVILFTLIFLTFTTLVAGLLPALYAWRFQPIAIMRKSVRLKGVNWLNKTLTVGQFAFSIAVLTAGVTFSQNKVFLDNIPLGYDEEGIYVIELQERKQFGPLKQQVDQIPGVQTAGTSDNIGAWNDGSPATLKIDTATYEVSNYVVGEDYLDLLSVEIVTGRSFIKGSKNDQSNSVLVNQEFARKYFEGNSPVNEVITVSNDRKTIVGVTRDIIKDVYEDAVESPSIISMGPDTVMRYLVIKTASSDIPTLEANLKTIWSDLYDLPYQGRSQGDLAVGNAKKDSDNLQKIFLTMALLGGFLSLAGIFALAKLNVARRLKEITIRKVLGATVKELLVAINRSFAITLAASLVTGSALGFLVSQTVLSLIYKHHVPVTPLTSLSNGALIVIFSVLMITLAVYVPARTNPVQGLREE